MGLFEYVDGEGVCDMSKAKVAPWCMPATTILL